MQVQSSRPAFPCEFLAVKLGIVSPMHRYQAVPEPIQGVQRIQRKRHLSVYQPSSQSSMTGACAGLVCLCVVSTSLSAGSQPRCRFAHLSVAKCCRKHCCRVLSEATLLMPSTVFAMSESSPEACALDLLLTRVCSGCSMPSLGSLLYQVPGTLHSVCNTERQGTWTCKLVAHMGQACVLSYLL